MVYWTLDYFQLLYKEYTTCGVSVRDFCREQGIQENRFYYWIKKLKSQTVSALDKRFDDFSKRLPYLEKELGRKHVTRIQLWEEYIAEYPAGYGFTQFCFHLNQYRIAQQPSTVLVNSYVAGEKCYVDFAGDTMPYIDMDTGEVIKVQTFVGCLPYTCIFR